MKRIVLAALFVCGCGQPAPLAQVTIAREPPSARAPEAAHHEGVAREADEGGRCIFCWFDRARNDNARTSLKALHAVAEMWRATHVDECPSPQRLKDDKDLDPSSDLNDPWGSPYKIVCDDDSTTVVSFGPDGKEGTPDDLRYPEKH